MEASELAELRTTYIFTPGEASTWGLTYDLVETSLRERTSAEFTLSATGGRRPGARIGDVLRLHTGRGNAGGNGEARPRGHLPGRLHRSISGGIRPMAAERRGGRRRVHLVQHGVGP
ncbi:conserved hypothetical protein [Streptomyces pristinaespiralis ATCC 25486]|uniref:Uncharacterized protein n=1 Tax=Streptomyces pristinaespiralis (strain ATCC 25486 / DSM 40338 / CBS 914.69 / JCM 4507 / KCC S-0507 / NBRC 13074 / NRRL 2958 / 5647) TaxID=457429 RepID=B5HF03_STRE2|nr:conserved hypothetical protein [Streptomyces pristinaespiralis ATCC 25486]